MKDDGSRRAVVEAAHRLVAVKKNFRMKFPYGPTKVQLSPTELRKVMERSSEFQRSKVMASMGTQKLLEVLAEGRNGNQ